MRAEMHGGCRSNSGTNSGFGTSALHFLADFLTLSVQFLGYDTCARTAPS
jgi:hypothetical protein